jgi:hypothetical protein
MSTTQSIKINSYTGFQPLKTCLVGRSYPPEFYSKISNPKVRSVMETVAQETEEDYQSLIKLIQRFGVDVVRPEIASDNNFEEYKLILDNGLNWYQPPPMTPRDNLLVHGNRLFVDRPHGPEYRDFYDPVIDRVDGQIFHSKDYPCLQQLPASSVTRVGQDVYFDQIRNVAEITSTYFKDYNCHIIKTGGHSDGVYCPVTPGLIISLHDVPTYSNTFPDWEVVYLPYQSWDRVTAFLELKKKNQGKWWIPEQEMNNDLVEFVETWLTHWVGYVEETVFDVNMLVIDEHNVICNNYNKLVFDALEKHQVTPHICNFRHRYFWDGGLHCITLDLVRDGTVQKYV